MSVRFFGIEKVAPDAKVKPKILTVERLDNMTHGDIIATGEVENSPYGVFMVDDNFGEALRWVAIAGAVNDWTIYIHWATHSQNFVIAHGDKIINPNNIKKLVPCTPDAFARYRY